MFLHGLIRELTHFSEAGATCPPNPDASHNWVVGESFSSLQKLRTSLASGCGWCMDVIFHQFVEAASTLTVSLEKQDHPMQFVTPMAQNSPTALCAGSTISEEHLPVSTADQSVIFVPHSIAVLHSHLGRAAFVGGCM